MEVLLEWTTCSRRSRCSEVKVTECRFGMDVLLRTQTDAPSIPVLSFKCQSYLDGLVGHFVVDTVERIVSDVADRADPTLSKQTTVAALRHAISLHGADLLQGWQARTAVYPEGLARAMVREHIGFGPFWTWRMLVERDEWLLFRHNLGGLARRILLILLGLNRVYYPGHKWVDRLIAELRLAPPDLGARLRALLLMEPRAAGPALGALVEETVALVEREMPEMDTAVVRERLTEPMPAWDGPPDEMAEP